MSASEESSPEASRRRRAVIFVSSVRASSEGDRSRLMYERAFGVESIDGIGERRHSGGMRESWLARFLAARSW